jgi:thymidylate synthase (FAD)
MIKQFPEAERLARPAVPELDAVLGEPFGVLDQGFVRVVDYMGSDAAIVQAARVSYGAGTKRVQDDIGLIRYLMRHRHTTPFEMCEIKLHVRVPMDCWRQWIRHRTANVNEYSTRYSVAIDAVQQTAPDQWRAQSASNRQGSGGYLDAALGEELTAEERQLQALAATVYQKRLDSNVAREQARKDLPLSTYTEAYWKIDLHNLLHFLALRMDPHAQAEIRAYAGVIGEEIVRRWCPSTWDAFQGSILEGMQLSLVEQTVTRHLVSGDQRAALDVAKESGWLSDAGEPKQNRERIEFEAKASRLGLHLPWILA